MTSAVSLYPRLPLTLRGSAEKCKKKLHDDAAFSSDSRLIRHFSLMPSSYYEYWHFYRQPSALNDKRSLLNIVVIGGHFARRETKVTADSLDNFTDLRNEKNDDATSVTLKFNRPARHCRCAHVARIGS